MATQSFYQDIVLKTQDEVDRLVAAFDEADRRGPIDTSKAHKVIDDSKQIEEILRGSKNDRVQSDSAKQVTSRSRSGASVSPKRISPDR